MMPSRISGGYLWGFLLVWMAIWSLDDCSLSVQQQQSCTIIYNSLNNTETLFLTDSIFTTNSTICLSPGHYSILLRLSNNNLTGLTIRALNSSPDAILESLFISYVKFRQEFLLSLEMLTLKNLSTDTNAIPEVHLNSIVFTGNTLKRLVAHRIVLIQSYYYSFQSQGLVLEAPPNLRNSLVRVSGLMMDGQGLWNSKKKTLLSVIARSIVVEETVFKDVMLEGGGLILDCGNTTEQVTLRNLTFSNNHWNQISGYLVYLPDTPTTNITLDFINLNCNAFVNQNMTTYSPIFSPPHVPPQSTYIINNFTFNRNCPLACPSSSFYPVYPLHCLPCPANNVPTNLTHCAPCPIDSFATSSFQCAPCPILSTQPHPEGRSYCYCFGWSPIVINDAGTSICIAYITFFSFYAFFLLAFLLLYLCSTRPRSGYAYRAV